MKALQYVEIGQPPRVMEVEKPTPGPGQVLLKVTAAGACHSDEFVMGLPEEAYVYGLPLTLGHEGAGIVAEVGAGVTAVAVGDSVAVYGPWGCGVCPACARGEENYCHVAAERHIVPPGLGAPGAMAEFMLVDDERHLVPLGDLDLVQNVSLTDAGLTPYHAIKPSLPALVPGSIAVVIGAGGLGHIGIQILRAMSPAIVVALDVSDDKLQLAKDVGAHHTFRSDESAVEQVRALGVGRGATAVFDFVGIEPTTALAAKLTHPDSEIVVVGVGPGAVPVGIFTLPWETKVRAPYWGSRSELFEVLELARSGLIHVETETFSLDDAPTAYERMHAGTLRGRAVIVP
ncbi:propanol-preferring alcohol dehydrogenase [Humibacillus xanthopallidus]|uniref:alcohol dehydrogenase n=1 Tax=Humibacillus xanthopallidus TaxID=412689 RepID=A0A543PNT7_9MICO|nr:NAD(P)-dependent alcohol dehydrogenase [Humibacillus xanthopallidus]TQN45743.1 propanol-preferring alcohol dehydrogenase [Humibacillus xanthopallidus]